jgi:hypothetical protein
MSVQLTYEQRCLLADMVNGCICAGTDLGNPLFVLYDVYGQPTGIDPATLSPRQIIALVEHWSDSETAAQIAQHPALTLH